MKSKLNIKTISIISSVVLICLVVPIITHAGLANSIAKAIFRFLGNIILGICTFFLKLSANFFQDMIYAGFDNYSNVIRGAWATIRDFANIFFIFGMIAVAFATILRREKYGIKQILPKLIITALLINFSMVFCYIFIDISNIISKSFINMAEKEYKTSLGDKATFSGAIADGLNQTKLLMPATCMDDEEYEDALGSCKDLQDVAGCEERVKTEQKECLEKRDIAIKQAKTVKQNQTAFEVFTTIVASAIIIIITTVILFAGGIVLIARVVMIWVLVALAPLAAVCSFLPTLRSSWEKWSKNFLNWCIFAPVYSLFIWLALKISLSIKENALATQAIINFDAGSAFFLKGSVLVKYAMVIGILLAGLITAKQIGVAGGDMAFNMLKKGGGKVKDWSKKKTGKLLRETGESYRGAARQAAGKGFQKIPGLKTFGAKMEAKGKLDWRKPLSSKEATRQKEVFGAMTQEQRAIAMNSKRISSSDKLLLAQVAVEKKDKFAKDNKYAKQAHDAFQAYGMIPEATEMERRNPQIVDDLNKRKERTKEGIARGYHKDWGEETFQGADGEMLTETMAETARDFHEFARTFSEMSIEAQEAWKKAAQTMLPMSEETRKAYAIVTGSPEEAYASAPAHMKGYIEAMRSNELENVAISSMPKIAEYVSASAAIGARGMSDDKKKALATEWKINLDNILRIATGRGYTTPTEKEKIDAINEKLNILKRSPEWKSFVK